MVRSEVNLPSDFKNDVNIAVDILLRYGANEVYLFGSLARGENRSGSDIDIATVGLPKNRFFAAYGELLTELRHPVDLVGLDYDNDFAREVRMQGGILRVA